MVEIPKIKLRGGTRSLVGVTQSGSVFGVNCWWALWPLTRSLFYGTFH